MTADEIVQKVAVGRGRLLFVNYAHAGGNLYRFKATQWSVNAGRTKLMLVGLYQPLEGERKSADQSTKGKAAPKPRETSITVAFDDIRDIHVA